MKPEELYEAWKNDPADDRPPHVVLGMEWEEFDRWMNQCEEKA